MAGKKGKAWDKIEKSLSGSPKPIGMVIKETGASRQIIHHHIKKHHLVLLPDDMIALRIEGANDLYYRLCRAAEESWLTKGRPPMERELSMAVGVVQEDLEFKKALHLFAAKTDWREGEAVERWKDAFAKPQAWEDYERDLGERIRKAYKP